MTNIDPAIVSALRAHQTIATGLGEWCCKCSPMEWRPTAYRSLHVAEHLAPLVEAARAERDAARAEVLPRQVERGAECFHGTPGACLTLRCGSTCDNRFDRMHPCPACLITDLHAARAEVARLRAEAWDEGYEASTSDMERRSAPPGANGPVDPTPNPYALAAIEDQP